MSRRYLERELQTMTDPYDLAVVTWALMKAQASGADLAFERLDFKKRVSGEDRSLDADHVVLEIL